MPSPWDLQEDNLHADCRILKVRKQRLRRRSDGIEGEFFVLDTNDWVNVLPYPDQDIVLSASSVTEKEQSLNLPVAWWKEVKIHWLPD